MKRKFILLFLMLFVSILVVTAAGYAWFTVSAISEVNGTNVKAQTEGFLKVWTPNNNGLTNQYMNYTTYIDFTEGDFANPGYTNHVMTNQSGNGYLFYDTLGTNSNINYREVSGVGVALSFSLYFSAFTGSSGGSVDTREVFLTNDSIIDSGSLDLGRAVRIAFIDKNDQICGIFKNSGSEGNFVTSGDYNFGNGQPPTTSGIIFGDSGEAVANNSTTIPEITFGSTIFKINANAFTANDKLKVVIWFEGTDSYCNDAVLGQDVDIRLVFAARVPEGMYTISYYMDGGTNNAINPRSFTELDFPFSLFSPTKPGYTFVGWFNSFDVEVTQINTIGNKVVFAKWILNP